MSLLALASELEADEQAYSYLTFKRFLLRIYTTR